MLDKTVGGPAGIMPPSQPRAATAKKYNCTRLTLSKHNNDTKKTAICHFKVLIEHAVNSVQTYPFKVAELRQKEAVAFCFCRP